MKFHVFLLALVALIIHAAAASPIDLAEIANTTITNSESGVANIHKRK